jgi:hypothetical protein
VPEQVRYAQMVWEMMHVLQDAAEPLAGSQVADAVRERLPPTPYELERVKSGNVRWTSCSASDQGRPRQPAG